MNKFCKLKKSFTLIELLVVVAILAILSSFIAFAGLGHIKDARDSARKSDLATLRRALTYYYFDHLSYPDPGIYAGGDGVVHGSDSRDGPDWIPGLRPDYLKTLPRDPKQAGVTSYLAKLFPMLKSVQKGQVAAVSTDRSAIDWRGFYLHPNNASLYQSNSDVLTGTIIELRWENIEEVGPGIFKAGQIDQLKNGVINAANAGARVGVRIMAGADIPAWLCDGVTLPVAERPQCVTIPDPAATVAVPWDPNYQTRYTILVNKVMRELGSLPQSAKDKIYWVNVGAGVQFNEMSIKDTGFPSTKDILCDPPVNYTASKYRDAWVQATNTWVNARDTYLPGVPVLVHLDSAPRDATNATDCKKSNNLNVANMVADAVCPNSSNCDNIWFGTASMSKGKQQGSIDLFSSLLTRTKVGFQIRDELITGPMCPSWVSGGIPCVDEYEGAVTRGLEIRNGPNTGPEYISVRSEEITIPELKAITQKYQPCFVNKIPPTSDPVNPCTVAIPPSISCSPAISTVGKDEMVNLSAKDGTGSYTWFAPGGNPFTTGSGSSFSVSFSTYGSSNNVVVTDSDGAEATCVVNVTTTGGGGGGPPEYFYIYTVAADLQTFTLSAKLEGDGTQYTLPAYPGSPPVIPQE